jgi:hypothetical protein
MTPAQRERWEQLGQNLAHVLDQVGPPVAAEAMLEAIRDGLLRSGVPRAQEYADVFVHLMTIHGHPLAPAAADASARRDPRALASSRG